jgi:hypothetical protein
MPVFDTNKLGGFLLTQTSIVVLTCCRMAMRVCSGIYARRQTDKQVSKCIYKSISIYVLKDSKQ